MLKKLAKLGKHKSELKHPYKCLSKLTSTIFWKPVRPIFHMIFIIIKIEHSSTNVNILNPFQKEKTFTSTNIHFIQQHHRPSIHISQLTLAIFFVCDKKACRNRETTNKTNAMQIISRLDENDLSYVWISYVSETLLRYERACRNKNRKTTWKIQRTKRNKIKIKQRITNQ